MFVIKRTIYDIKIYFAYKLYVIDNLFSKTKPNFFWKRILVRTQFDELEIKKLTS